jgi:hypothetical protein
MGFLLKDDVIAYTADKNKILCKQCAEKADAFDVPLEAILQAEKDDGMVIICDDCGKVIRM